MESQSPTQEHESLSSFCREVPVVEKKSGLGNVFCKMGKGWTCVITKTGGPDAGKVFLKCGENCTCTLDGETVSQELNLPPDVVGSVGSGSGAFCKCGEGWSCVIFRTEGPDAGSGKGFAECAGRCSCTVDHKLTHE
ncbi:uncharacterized protein LOC113869088 [Abrus precatorius]|uniref:Uncharacterized protein LOC113869088 n=1 Tax=Abrus precatorius TaxID=3816 RepID=A0A8B8LXC4_ABRPR|nr:uncharacterized protein LOC113869088 [Abrus precatorius]